MDFKFKLKECFEDILKRDNKELGQHHADAIYAIISAELLQSACHLSIEEVGYCCDGMLRLESLSSSVALKMWQALYCRFVKVYHDSITQEHKLAFTVALLSEISKAVKVLRRNPATALGETALSCQFFCQRLSCSLSYFSALASSLPIDILGEAIFRLLDFTGELVALSSERRMKEPITSFSGVPQSNQASDKIIRAISIYEEIFAKAIRQPTVISAGVKAKASSTQTSEATPALTSGSSEAFIISQSNPAPSSMLHRCLLKCVLPRVCGAETLGEEALTVFVPLGLSHLMLAEITRLANVSHDDTNFQTSFGSSVQTQSNMLEGLSTLCTPLNAAEIDISMVSCLHMIITSISVLSSNFIADQHFSVIKQRELLVSTSLAVYNYVVARRNGLQSGEQMKSAGNTLDPVDMIVSYLLSLSCDHSSYLSSIIRDSLRGSCSGSGNVLSRIGSFVLTGFMMQCSDSIRVRVVQSLLLILQQSISISNSTGSSKLVHSVADTIRTLALVLPVRFGFLLVDHVLHCILSHWKISSSFVLEQQQVGVKSDSHSMNTENYQSAFSRSMAGVVCISDCELILRNLPLEAISERKVSGEISGTYIGPIISNLVQRALVVVSDWGVHSHTSPDSQKLPPLPSQSIALTILQMLGRSISVPQHDKISRTLRSLLAPIDKFLEASVFLNKNTPESDHPGTSDISRTFQCDPNRLGGVLRAVTTILLMFRVSAMPPPGLLGTLRLAKSASSIAIKLSATLKELSLDTKSDSQRHVLAGVLLSAMHCCCQCCYLSFPVLTESLLWQSTTNNSGINKRENGDGANPSNNIPTLCKSIITQLCLACTSSPQNIQWMMYLSITRCLMETVKLKRMADEFVPRNWKNCIKALQEGKYLRPPDEGSQVVLNTKESCVLETLRNLANQAMPPTAISMGKENVANRLISSLTFDDDDCRDALTPTLQTQCVKRGRSEEGNANVYSGVHKRFKS